LRILCKIWDLLRLALEFGSGRVEITIIWRAFQTVWNFLNPGSGKVFLEAIALKPVNLF